MIDISQYDDNNVFSKILNGEIPCEKVFENDEVLAFNDINPQAPIHIVVIPKKKFCSINDFTKENDLETLGFFLRSIGDIARNLNLKDGYRVICNTGFFGGQEIPHLHFHILSGRPLGRLVS